MARIFAQPPPKATGNDLLSLTDQDAATGRFVELGCAFGG